MAGTVELYTFGYTYLYEHALNAVALILKQQYISSLITTTEVVGMILVIYSIKKQGLSSLSNWLLSITLAFTMLFTGNVTVNIIDGSESGATPTAQVAGIPYGLALLFTLTNNIGAGLTFAFDNVLHGTNDPSYSKTGFLMNQRVVSSVQDYQITNPLLRQNIDSYIKNCVFYDILLDAYSVDELTNASSISEFLASHSGINRGIDYGLWQFNEDATRHKAYEFKTCREAIHAINHDLTQDVPNIIKIMAPSVYSMVKKKENADFSALLKAQLGTSFSYLAKVNSTSSENLVKQAAWSNAIKNGIRNYAGDTNSTAGIMNAIAYEKAKNQKAVTNGLMAVFGREYLPLAKPLFECAIYFGYIFVAVMMLLPNRAGILWFYIKLLMWINLWSPIFAIFDSMANYLTQEAVTAKLDAASTITFNNYQSIANTNLELASIAGYLSFTATAYIAFYMISRSDYMINTVAGLFSNDVASHVQSAANDLGSHNLNLGNTNLASANYYSEHGNQVATSPNLHNLSRSEQTQSGSLLTHHTTGTETLNANVAVSQLPVKPALSQGLTESFGKQVDAKKEELTSNQHHLQVAQNALHEKGKHIADFVNKLDQASLHQNIAKTDGFHKGIDSNQSHKSSELDQHAVENTRNATIRGTVSSGTSSIPFIGKSLPASVNAEGILDKTNTHKDTDLRVDEYEKTSANTMRVDDLVNVLHQYNATHNDEKGKRLEKDYRESESYLKHVSNDVTKSQSELKSLSDHKSFVDSHSASVATDLEQSFYESLHKQYTNDEITELVQHDPQKLTSLASDYINSNFEQVSDRIDHLQVAKDFKSSFKLNTDIGSTYENNKVDLEKDFVKEKEQVAHKVKEYQMMAEATQKAADVQLNKLNEKAES